MIVSKQIHKPRLVLVVDDQEINRDALGIILEEDYSVIYASNGKEALDMIRENANDLSIVMLDLMMPVMNGFEVLEVMKGDANMKNIPVIVLTAEKNAELKALQMGAADFITKPFDVHEVILARVGRIIELSEGRRLISAAETDELTKLYSRNFFFEYANRLYTYHPELKLDAIVVNIEQFHSINEVNGRKFGDEVLKLIGEEIKVFLFDSQGIACRFDSDRFGIYCVHHDDYTPLLEKLLKRVNGISEKVKIGLRMGVKPWREGVEPILMFDHASAACSMVRGDYQNPIMVYNDDMGARDHLNRMLLNDLHQAIEKKQLHIYYQPKYDIQCDPPRLCSAEALIRWNHPELGLILPATFIPLFEGNGLIGLIDDYVWHEAAEQVAKWKKKYGISFPVSVNVSRPDVFDLTFTEKLKRLINDNRLDYKDVKLEITESAYTDNAKYLIDVIESLRETGFEIEMDDFGSGYSSLNMISSMPIDVLKMDMKFIRNIEKSETDRRLVNLILDIAKYLNVTVVAEGVETEGQMRLLRNAGCDMVQGFYFSRPLPAEDFEKLIEREITEERK